MSTSSSAFDLLLALAPQVAGGRRGVDDRAALGHAVEQALRQRAQREVVHREHGGRRWRVGHAGVVEQRVHRPVDLRDGVAHRGLVGEIRGEERVVRPARRVEIDRGHVRGVELGEHVEQRRADSTRRARHDDTAALVAERVRHGLCPSVVDRLDSATRRLRHAAEELGQRAVQHVAVGPLRHDLPRRRREVVVAHRPRRARHRALEPAVPPRLEARLHLDRGDALAESCASPRAPRTPPGSRAS